MADDNDVVQQPITQEEEVDYRNGHVISSLLEEGNTLLDYDCPDDGTRKYGSLLLQSSEEDAYSTILPHSHSENDGCVPPRRSLEQFGPCDGSKEIISRHDAVVNVRWYNPLSYGGEGRRSAAIALSLTANIVILVVKGVAFVMTSSLSVLAALMDSALDVASQVILYYAEKSSKESSFDLYPAGTSRLEPVGVIMCAALMGMASFEVLKQTVVTLWDVFVAGGGPPVINSDMTSIKSMICIVAVKFFLYLLCKGTMRDTENVIDSSMEALAQDHLNDCLSNVVAAIALISQNASQSLWIVDPIGAILISLYIIYSWYETGKEQIEHLAGKIAPTEYIEELYEIARTHDDRLSVDVCRAYHFGPKFLVELEVVLPRNMKLSETHDIGMLLQYKIEARSDVERCFVHIDYKRREYDEHVISKVPHLRIASARSFVVRSPVL